MNLWMFEEPIQVAATNSETFDMPQEEMLEYMSEMTESHQPMPGVTHFVNSAEISSEYFRYRRLLAFSEAYLAATNKPVTVWNYMHNLPNADPQNDRVHSKWTLRDPSLPEAYQVAMGDLVIIWLGFFRGIEQEFDSAVQAIAENAPNIAISQLHIPNPVLFPEEVLRRTGLPYSRVVEGSNIFALPAV